MRRGNGCIFWGRPVLGEAGRRGGTGGLPLVGFFIYMAGRKIIINMAVPSNSSGGEASMVAEVAEVEENSTNKMQTLRLPPVITVNKSAAYAVFDLTYIRDVPYKPQEYYVKTRKCEPDADAHVVKICERLKDDQGQVIEASQLTSW